MGHIINPISLRLGVNSYWNTTWSLNNKHLHNKLLKQNWFFFQFLNWFFYRKVHIKINLVFSHYKIYVNNLGKIYINLYYYWPGINKKKRLFFFKVISFLRNKYKGRKYKKFPSKIYYKLRANFRYILSMGVLNLYWYLISKYWVYYLNFFNFEKTKFILRFWDLHFNNVTANTITKYITSRLQKKYTLMYVLRPVLRDLYFKQNQKRIKGYKLVCSGRFTRKQIATKTWFKRGAISSNQLLNNMDYSYRAVKLKYGVCGIKLWINYGDNELDTYLKKNIMVYPTQQTFCKNVINNLNFNLSINNWTAFYWKIHYNRKLKKIFYLKLLKIKNFLIFNLIFKKYLLHEIKFLKQNKKLLNIFLDFFINYPFKYISLKSLNSNNIQSYLNFKEPVLFSVSKYKA